jgi:hypothetical protein
MTLVASRRTHVIANVPPEIPQVIVQGEVNADTADVAITEEPPKDTVRNAVALAFCLAVDSCAAQLAGPGQEPARMPGRGPRVPGWTPPPGRGCPMPEVQACPSPHHRPRQSRAELVPRSGALHLEPRRSARSPAGGPTGMTIRTGYARRRARPYIQGVPRASPAVALGSPGQNGVNRGKSRGSRQVEQQVSGPIVLPNS